jgi:dihydrodipicolinate synthase
MTLFKGIFTALITPFYDDGSLNYDGLLQNMLDQLDAGVHGLILFGSTGEAESLTSSEVSFISKETVKEFKGKVPLIFGTTHCNTEVAIDHAREAEMNGADGLLIAPPYYMKPTQEGIYRHYKAIAEATTLPIILYNNPSRCGVSINSETVQRLSSIPNFAAVKECSGRVDKLTQQPLPVLTGDDPFLLPALSLGCPGIVSILSNLFPHTFVEIYHLCQENDFHAARKLYEEIALFISALSLETNPIIIKKLMEIHGKPSGAPRLPLTPPSPKTEQLLVEYAKKPILC